MRKISPPDPFLWFLYQLDPQNRKWSKIAAVAPSVSPCFMQAPLFRVSGEVGALAEGSAELSNSPEMMRP